MPPDFADPVRLPPLPLAHFRLRVVMKRPWRLPGYAGSKLRGLFGHALRATACRCSGDLHDRDCLFAACFLQPSGKRGETVFPYVILPPTDGGRDLAAGEGFDLEFVLAGSVAGRSAEFMTAWRCAFAEWLGSKRGDAELAGLELLLPGRSVPCGDLLRAGGATPLPPWVLPPFDYAGESVSLVFDTPLRIHREGRPLEAGELEARTLCLSLLRRLQGLFGTDLLPPGDVTRLLNEAEGLRVTANRTRWRDLTRYSNRQEREVRLGGLTGSLRLEGDLSAWMPLLYAGQVVHLGKNTTLGFGHYRLA